MNETGDVIPARDWITPEGQTIQDESIRRWFIVYLEDNAM